MMYTRGVNKFARILIFLLLRPWGSSTTLDKEDDLPTFSVGLKFSERRQKQEATRIMQNRLHGRCVSIRFTEFRTCELEDAR